MSKSVIPAAEYHYGAIKIDIYGEIGNLELVVWDQQVRPAGELNGREIYTKDNFHSVEQALDEAARRIAIDSGNNAEQVRKDIREYQADRRGFIGS